MSTPPSSLSASPPLPPSAPAPSSSETSHAVASVTRRPEFAAIVEWTLIVASYGILFFGEHWVGSDGGERFDALSELLTRGHLLGTKFSLVGPLFSTPLWFIGKWFGNARLACAYYNWLLFGVAIAVFARLLKGLLAPSTVRRFLLLLVAGSMFTEHVQTYYGEVFTAVFVAAGVLCVCTKRSPWLGWTAIVLGAVNTPASGMAAGAVCLYFAIESRRLRFLLPVLAIVALGVAEALLRRGAMKSGYEGAHGNPTLLPYSARPGFSYPLFLGVLSLLMSFGKGIVFYAPGVFAPVGDFLQGKPDLLRTYRAWLIFLAGLVVVYAKWWGWYGGECWGPRYVLFASILASFALALNLGVQRSIARSVVTLVMLTFSIWIGADGVMFHQQQLGQCWANGYALEHLCWYVPEFAAWIRPFIMSRPLETKDWLFIGVYAAVYVYLAAPVVAFLARSIRPRWVPHVRRIIDWRGWGF